MADYLLVQSDPWIAGVMASATKPIHLFYCVVFGRNARVRFVKGTLRPARRTPIPRFNINTGGKKSIQPAFCPSAVLGCARARQVAEVPVLPGPKVGRRSATA